MEDHYSLGEDITAASVYERLTGARQPVVDMARDMAELTIPSLFPPDGYKVGDDIPGNNQSVGAHCVNTLTSHLVFMAFPPNQPIARLTGKPKAVREALQRDPEAMGRMQMALSQLEVTHRLRLQATTIMTAYTEYVRQLIVAGNALWRELKSSSPTAFRCDTYVVKRDKSGMPLLTILEECVNLQGMDKEHVDLILAVTPSQKFANVPEWEREVKTYAVMRLRVEEGDERVWDYWEEYEGHVLPGTEVTTDFDVPPMWPGWLIPVYGQDWGRSYCEEYRGDLYTMEAHASAVNDGASLAALSLLFVNPGSVTSIKQVQKAKNLSTLPGRADDLTVFRSDKTADFNFVAGNMETVARRLSQAFLLQITVQRTGERVTAEEIKRIGQELDKALGGLYTQIAQGNQKVIILRAFRVNEEEDEDIPELPPGVVDIQVITGLDALGDSTEADTLVDWAGTLTKLFPVEAQKRISVDGFGTRYGALRGVRTDGLLKTDEQVAAEDQQTAMQAAGQQLLDKATGPAVKGMADMAMQQQQQ